MEVSPKLCCAGEHEGTWSGGLGVWGGLSLLGLVIDSVEAKWNMLGYMRGFYCQRGDFSVSERKK